MPIYEIPAPRTWTRILFQCVHKQRETSAVVKNAQSYRPTSEDLVPEPKDEREKVEPRSSPVFHWKSIVLKSMILAETMKRWLFYYVIIVGHHPFARNLGLFSCQLCILQLCKILAIKNECDLRLNYAQMIYNSVFAMREIISYQEHSSTISS